MNGSPLLHHPFLRLTWALGFLMAATGLAADRQPPDSLSGPPFVSAAAWGVYDWDSGELIGGENLETPRSMASTTKMMTAWLVIQEIERDPDLAHETITFSERAGNTRGSSSRMAPGESVTVGDLLYGLMLPSGNDASVALAEHIGRRFLPAGYPANSEETGERDLKQAAYDAFVERMNSTAQGLGLTQTRFVNPHGLDADGHESTVADLARLALKITRHPHFRQITSTRTHSARIATADGGEREANWRNTNQLLGIEGYHGVKTGTTSRAGACLVSIGHREHDRLLVVVLGSASSAGRYVDSRNLYRWGWLELGHQPP